MYLKKKKFKVRLLKKKYFIDLWGQYKKKKKFSHKHYQRSLLWFSRVLDRTLYPPLKRVKRSYFPRWSLYRSRPRLYPRDKFGRLDKRSIQYRRPVKFRKILKFYSNLLAYRKPFRSRSLLKLLKIYSNWRIKTHFRIKRALSPRTAVKHILSLSIRRWRRSRIRKISWINTKRYRIKPEQFRRIYIKVKYTRRLETIRQQYYYGFDKAKNFLAFFRRVEIGYGSFKFKLGLEGLLSHLIFRCNLVPTVRSAHLLIRLRAIYVNNQQPVFTRHKCLKVGDSFGVVPRYIRTIYRYFRIFLKRRLLKINVPNYLEYNYKIMYFFIWRRPTRTERVYLHHLPYIKATPLKPALPVDFVWRR